jgi:hypothetical protein
MERRSDVQVLLILLSCFAFVTLLESLKSVKLVLCICDLLEFGN